MGFAYPIDSKVVTNPNGTVDYDRASSSAQLRGLIKSMITNGVNLTESTNLQVMADEETMNLVVKPGYVIIEGALKHFEDDVKVTLANADTTNPRIDTVVARLNLNEDVRDIVIDVLQGTPSAEPTAPELTRTTSYYEVGLADILVEVGATQISQAVVTDTRLLNSRCGMISAIGEIDTETLFNQLTTDFDNWFENIKGKLGDDVAGGLQMQINDLADDIDTLQEDVEILKGNDSTMVWDISENLYAESRDVSTMPRDISNGYVVKLKNIFYMLGGGSTAGTAVTSYKYVDNVWVEDAVLGNVSIYKTDDVRLSNYKATGGVVTNNNNMYITSYNASSTTARCTGSITTYDGATKSSVTNYFGSYDSSVYRVGNIGICAINNTYKTLSVAHCNSHVNGYPLNVGSTSSDGYKTIAKDKFSPFYCKERGSGKALQPLGQGLYYGSGLPAFLVGMRNYSENYHSTASYLYEYYDLKYYIVILNTDSLVKETIELPDHISIVTDMVKINDYIYITYVNGNVWRYGIKTCKWERVGIGMGSLVLHNGEIHKFYGTAHTACKLYRTAKTYAPKGTKIYLPYETSATSTNLQPIEGGYVVTESGNVELKIYDY